eukprot:2774206-Rhodomonas_salina.2
MRRGVWCLSASARGAAWPLLLARFYHFRSPSDPLVLSASLSLSLSLCRRVQFPGCGSVPISFEGNRARGNGGRRERSRVQRLRCVLRLVRAEPPALLPRWHVGCADSRVRARWWGEQGACSSRRATRWRAARSSASWRASAASPTSPSPTTQPALPVPSSLLAAERPALLPLLCRI